MSSVCWDHFGNLRMKIKRPWSKRWEFLWRLSGQLSMTKVGDNRFLFTFTVKNDYGKVRKGKPWCFHKSLLVLKDFDESNMDPEEVAMIKSNRNVYLDFVIAMARWGTTIKTVEFLALMKTSREEALEVSHNDVGMVGEFGVRSLDVANDTQDAVNLINVLTSVESDVQVDDVQVEETSDKGKKVL
ncbi:Uncharacterized protein TCM_017374 [Theobroma cacao]|uniref:DUF4283 domain-containing protein n=1 Tax=Theobroma cacao TaxID=3641 RepID=A0A061EEB6_THECC|nr:Uncharacterized protein TCM_017374 [Theobroma cacao]